MRCIILFSTMVLTAACATLRPAPIQQLVYVPIPADLTATKAVPEPRNDSGRELLRVARQRKADLQVCYADKDAIRSIQGSPVMDILEAQLDAMFGVKTP